MDNSLQPNINGLLDKCLPEGDENITAFLMLLSHFVNEADNEQVLLFEEIRNEAVSRTDKYQKFVAENFSSPVHRFGGVSTEPETVSSIQ